MNSSGRRFSPVAVLLAASLGGGASGCGLVVGSGDYVVGNVGDGGSTENPDAPNGPDGQPLPPVDGAVPESDATSQPDTSGPVGDGGPTRNDGGPACDPTGALIPGALPTSDAKFQQIVNACALAVSCDPLFFDVTVSDCITNDFLDTYPTQCLASIKSCDDYYACMGSRIATLAECPASADMDVGKCNGTTAVSCFTGGDGIISNCATLGGTCTIFHESDYTDFMDVAAGCSVINNCSDVTDGTSYCGPTPSHVYTCDPTDVTTTNVGISRQACPAGSACQKASGEARCLSTSPSCATPGTSCVNGNLTTCTTYPSGNVQTTSNCAAAGLQCTTSVSGTSACTAPGCANAGCTETCVGNKLQACIGGAPFLIDCPTLGLNTCNSGSNSVNVGYSFCSNQ